MGQGNAVLARTLSTMVPDKDWNRAVEHFKKQQEAERAKKQLLHMRSQRAKQKRIREEADMPCSHPPTSPETESPEGDVPTTVKDSGSFCQWAQVDSNQYIATGATLKRLRAGKYAIRWYKGSPSMEFRPLDVDEIYVFPNSIAETVLRESQDFWTKEDKYKEHNLLHRRGFLLHGSQGHGKTSIIQVIMQDVIARDGLVFNCNCDPDLVEQAVQNLRQVEPHRKLMCIFEDIDALIDAWGEDKLLAILDGENQVNYVLNIATSNHPEDLDYRLTNRPRRFDNIIRIGAVSRDERALYFSKKLEFKDDEEKNKWLDASDTFSFAALAEMVISIRILERGFDETIDRLKLMMKNKAIQKDGVAVGFGPEKAVRGR